MTLRVIYDIGHCCETFICCHFVILLHSCHNSYTPVQVDTLKQCASKRINFLFKIEKKNKGKETIKGIKSDKTLQFVK